MNCTYLATLSCIEDIGSSDLNLHRGYSKVKTTVDCHSVTYLLCYAFTMRHKGILPMIILWLTIFPGAGFEHWALVPLGLRPAATQNAKTQRANPLGYTHLMIAVCVCDVHVWISTINGCQLFRGRFDRNTLQQTCIAICKSLSCTWCSVLWFGIDVSISLSWVVSWFVFG